MKKPHCRTSIPPLAALAADVDAGHKALANVIHESNVPEILIRKAGPL